MFALFDWIDRWFSLFAGNLDQAILLPLLYRTGLMAWEDTSFNFLLAAVYGVFAIMLTFAVCWPLEKLWPLEKWENQGPVRTDFVYTVLNKVGIVPLIGFIVFYEIQIWASDLIISHGFIPPQLDSLFPSLLYHPVLTFFIYLLIFDCADYWRHRLSHTFRWWYALHTVHHAQRQMSLWSDDRNHVLDDAISAIWFGVVSFAIGVQPDQFPMLLLISGLVQSLSHANTRVSFGWLGERLLVSPQFHRQHHGLPAAGYNSWNYGSVFPYWDMLFGTASFSHEYLPTGDRRAPEALASGSYLAGQVRGVKYFFTELQASLKKRYG